MNQDLLWSGIIAAIISISITILIDIIKSYKNKNNLRLLIKLEIENNIAELEKLFQVVNENLGDYADSEYTWAANLASIIPMDIKNDLWSNKNPLFGSALKEKEIQKIDIFYNKLKNSISFHKQIIDLQHKEIENKKKEDYGGGDIYKYAKINVFLMNGPKKSKEFKKEYEETIACGKNIISNLKNKKII